MNRATVSIEAQDFDEDSPGSLGCTKLSSTTIYPSNDEPAITCIGPCVWDAVFGVACDDEAALVILARAITDKEFDHFSLQCNDEMKAKLKQLWEAADRIAGREGATP